MKIGVISDTHSLEIPKSVLDQFKKVDLIIHAGDFCSVADLKMLKEIKPVRAVYGNMDEMRMRQILPEKEIFSIENVVIGIFHGTGAAAKDILPHVQKQFAQDKVDVVIFGHSHLAFNEKMGKVLYFNPGSATDMVRAPYRSYGLLTINKGKVNAEIIKI